MAARLKICVLGLSLTSSWGNGHATTYRALLKALATRGHHITFFERDTPWYSANRDLDKPEFCQLVLYSSIAELATQLDRLATADAVILGSFVPEGIAITEMLLGRGMRRLLFYDIDTPVTLAGLQAGTCNYLAPRHIPRFNCYLSFSAGPALRLITERYRAMDARALYCSVDPELCRPVPVLRRWHLGYLGTYSKDRQLALEKFLVQPARCLPHLRFVVAGPQFPDTIDWPPNVRLIPHVPPGKHAEFFSSLHWTLNITRAEMVSLGYSPSVRLFEAAACGVPIISDRWEGLDTILAPGKEVVIADESEDVVRLLSGSATTDGAAIGLAGRMAVLHEHSASRRAEQLEQILGEITAHSRPSRYRESA